MEDTLDFLFILNKILLLPYFYFSGPVILSFLIFSFYILKKYKKNLIEIFENFIIGFFSFFMLIGHISFHFVSYDIFQDFIKYSLKYEYRILIFLFLISIPIYFFIKFEKQNKIILVKNDKITPSFVLLLSPNKITRCILTLKVIKFYLFGAFLFCSFIILVKLLASNLIFSKAITELGQLLIIIPFVLALLLPVYFWLKEFLEDSLIYNSALNSPQINDENKANKEGLFSLQRTFIDEGGWNIKYFGPYGKSIEHIPNKPSCFVNQHSQVRKVFDQYPKNIDLRKIFYLGREFCFVKPHNEEIHVEWLDEMQQILSADQRHALFNSNIFTYFKIIKIDDMGEWFKVKRLNDDMEFYFSFKIIKYPMLIYFDKSK